MRPRGLEPLFRKEAEPKSAAYTIFATGAYSFFRTGGGSKTFEGERDACGGIVTETIPGVFPAPAEKTHHTV